MQAKAEIESKDKELQVVAYAESGVQGKLFGKPVEPELSAWSLGVLLDEPDVTGIRKNGSVKVADKPEAVLDVHLELESTCLIEVREAAVVLGTVASGAHRAHSEGAQTVRTANVELLAVGGVFGIAVTVYGTYHDTVGNVLAAVDLP